MLLLTAKKSAKIRCMRHKKWLLLALFCVFLLFALWQRQGGCNLNLMRRLQTPVELQKICAATHRHNSSFQHSHRKPPLQLLWWDAMPESYQSTRICGIYACSFSSNRAQLSSAKAVLFYGSNLQVNDLPLPRLARQQWALLHEESPRNMPLLRHASVLRHFNWTATFSRHSDMPLTTQYLPDALQLTSPTYVVPVGAKSLLRREQHLAPIAFISSDCDTMSGRDDYVRELMRHIEVDSYGACLHNRDLPKNLTDDYLNNLYAPELYRFLARYKFILSYENGVCDDYITEKFWRPLVIGSVPIYFGSPTIKDWEPNKKSVIHIADFASPQDLANFIRALDADDTEYNSYLNHKFEQLEPITNIRLQHELSVREFYYDMPDANLFGAFECAVCRQMHELPAGQTHTAASSHYNCPLPLIYPRMPRAITNSIWPSVMQVGKCQADVLDGLLQKNANYTKHAFEQQLNALVQANQCG